MNSRLGKIYYFHRPAKEGHSTILFLPSFGGDHTYLNFKNIIDKLDSNYGILAIDTIGYGRSHSDDMHRNIDHILENYEDIIDHLNVNQLVLFGHSMGGIYSLLLARRINHLLQSLVLIEPPHSGIQEAFIDETNAHLEQFRQIAELKENGQINYESFLNAVNPLNSEADQKENAQLLFNVFGEKSIISEAENNAEILEAMHKIESLHSDESMPIVILCSKERESEYKESNLSSFGKVLSLNGNHFLHWSNEKEVLEAIRTFL